MRIIGVLGGNKGALDLDLDLVSALDLEFRLGGILVVRFEKD